MQQRKVSSIDGCIKGKFLLSIDTGKGNFCYPLMQERVISAIHKCSKGKFLLSMDASKGSFCYPWMQERVIFVIHGCRKKKFLLPGFIVRHLYFYGSKKNFRSLIGPHR